MARTLRSGGLVLALSLAACASPYAPGADGAGTTAAGLARANGDRGAAPETLSGGDPRSSQSLDSRGGLTVATANQLLVVLKPGVAFASFEARVRAAGGEVRGFDPRLGIASVEDASPSAVAGEPGVEEVSRDPMRPRLHILAGRVQDAPPPVPVGDQQPFQSLEWGLNVVQAPEAWATGDQGQGVTVAVLDTGVDADNPNLAPNLDLADSRSFVPGEDLTDLNGHGSHVAGIIAAARNGTGVAGVAPLARIMSVKVLDKDAYGDDFDILEGIRYAADHHANVINLSLEDRLQWGDGSTGDAEMAYERAIRYATMNGSLVVAGVGNDSEEDRTSGWVHIPADLPLVLGAAAVGPVGQKNFDAFARYSNWGSPMVQVAAPGGGVGWNAQTGPVIVDPRDLVFSTWSTHAIPHVIDGITLGPAPWSYMAGTSMASAFTSGVAAIAIAAHAEPPMAIAERIRRTAIGSGYNPYTGSGVVNALGVATN